MTSTSSEEEKENNKFVDNLKSFGIYILSFLILLFLLFLSGSSLLYSCKIAQSSVLPFDKDCLNDSQVQIQKGLININIFGKESEKMSVLLDNENKKDSLLDILRQINERPFQSSTVLYFTSILQDLFLFNVQIQQYFLSSFNQNCSENVILWLIPLISPILFIIIMILNWFGFFYIWFSKLTWIFKTNVNENKTELPKWEDTSSLTNPISMALSLFIVFCLGMLSLVWIFVPLPLFLGLLLMTYTFIKFLTIVGEKNKEKYYFTNFLGDTFKYHSSSIMFIISLFTLIGVFTTFGTLLACLLLVLFFVFYMQWIPIPIYTQNKPENLTAWTSFETLKKTCLSMVNDTKKKQNSWISFLQQKGGTNNNNTHEFKKLTKYLKSL